MAQELITSTCRIISSLVYVFLNGIVYDKKQYTISPDVSITLYIIYALKILFILGNSIQYEFSSTVFGVIWLCSPVSSMDGTLLLWLIHKSDCFIVLSPFVLPISHFWKKSLFYQSLFLWSKIFVLSSPLLNGDNVFLIFHSLFPHIVPPSTNMFLQ